jgi:hypothetical protein
MFASLFRKRSARSGPAPRRACLGVESLEGRAAPSTVLTNHAPFLSAPDAHGPAHVGSAGDVTTSISRGTGEEIPQSA